MSALTITTGKVWADSISESALVSVLPENLTFKSPGDYYLAKVDPFAYTNNNLLLKAGCAFDMDISGTRIQFSNREDLTFTPASILDTGNVLSYAKNYYVYLCIVGTTPELVVSLNSTYPDGFTAATSRKIGFFHNGEIRKVSDDGSWVPIDASGNKWGSTGTIWQQNVTQGIIPNSVGDLKNKPRVYVPGIVKVGNVWHFIYKASIDETPTFLGAAAGAPIGNGTLKSEYGCLPATGTEGLNGFNFLEIANKMGIRLPTMQEINQACFGAPQGEDSANNYGWTSTGHTARTYTGCYVNTSTGVHDTTSGVKPYAISAYNLVDPIGDVWEWSASLVGAGGSSFSAYGNQRGSTYGTTYQGLHGGGWSVGAICGPCCMNWGSTPSDVDTNIGARPCCDAA